MTNGTDINRACDGASEPETQAESVVKQIRQAREWLNAANTPDKERYRKGMSMESPKKVLQDLRRAERKSEKIARAARANLSVAIYGQSQVGKSHMVSVFARPEEGAEDGVEIDFGNATDGPIRFHGGINPDSRGGVETTGLVTRFREPGNVTTTSALIPSDMRKRYPVQLRMLSEADVIIVLMKVYFQSESDSPGAEGADVLEPELTEDDVKQYMEEAAREHRDHLAQGIDPVIQNEIMDALEYAEQHIVPRSTRKVLNQFWIDAPELASGLGLERRSKFLSILWKYDKLTQTYVSWVRAIEELGRQEYVHADIAALCHNVNSSAQGDAKYRPHDSSIVLVETFTNVDDDSGSDDQLGLCVVGDDGKVSERKLSRRIICSLAAELILPLTEPAAGLPAGTDVLDLPGARSPERFDSDSNDESLRRSLLRAKLNFLFERYTVNLEIGALVVLFKKDPTEVVEMIRRIDWWVSAMHGAGPETRRHDDCRLFLVLGQMDTTIRELAGKRDLEDCKKILLARVNSALERFVDSGNFVEEWAVDRGGEAKAFENMFWFRNPTYRGLPELLEYDGEAETGMQQGKDCEWAQLQESMKEVIESSAAIGRHFNDSDVAADALFQIGDGGAKYIRDKVATKCTVDAKDRRISELLAEEIDRISQRLSRFHGDVQENNFESIEKMLDEVCRRNGKVDGERCGALLSCLSVKEEELHTHLYTTTVREAEDGVGERERASFFATESMRFWASQAESSIKNSHLSLEKLQDNCEELVAEIGAGARTDELAITMRDELRNERYPLPHQESETEVAQVVSIICAEHINRYIYKLGKHGGEHGTNDSGGKSDREPKGGDELAVNERLGNLFDADAEEYVRHQWDAWMRSLKSMCDRISADGKEDIDPELDRMLGNILSNLRQLRQGHKASQ